MTAQLKLSQHAEWLSLVEVSGPFLAESILKDAFPQGLEKLDPFKKKQFRQTYDEWREIIDSHSEEDEAIKEQIHKEWINWVIKFGLEWDEDDDGDILKTGDAIPEDVQLQLPEHGVTLKPEFAVYADEQQKPYLLLTSYPAGTPLEEVIKGESWSTTPAERMAQLCRATGTRLGIITNGEQWLFIDAPEGGITTYASWYARLWSQESVTLQAFFSLLNIGTIFNGFEDAKKLTELLDESLKHQDEVTETLGEQVSRAVEVLIQSLDRINHDHNGKLLEGVEPTELYEAGLTLMMRLVFLLCAEERGLLLLGDETYESNYALSTLRLKLREEAGLHGEEVLSYRKNAWSRLLAIFRAVYGGVEHENMRMPALGGSLFDPDRFPFLEGRSKGSSWKVEEAKPLPIDNRTVLLFLDAIQLYRGRTLSYRALDVEQIGYVYEGLLEKTVIRAPDVTLELNGSKSAKQPWVELKELASAELDGDAAVKKLLKERTKSSAGRINSDLDKELTDTQLDKLLAACHNDAELRDRLKPYYHFLRLDAWANPLVYPEGSYMVTAGIDRDETGSHYTRTCQTEPVVNQALRPLVYDGVVEGLDLNLWKLKSAEEILNLKICDMAMGSGAFLVQACRWLSERLCEAWEKHESNGDVIGIDGFVRVDGSVVEILPVEKEERYLIAKRLVAERCLYGVDVNHLAVELAKLSLWIVTLADKKPFGFLDHNLKHGNSLLGITSIDQLLKLEMGENNNESTEMLFAQDLRKSVELAVNLRNEIRSKPILDIRDVEAVQNLDFESREVLKKQNLIADGLISNAFIGEVDSSSLSVIAGEVISGKEAAVKTLTKIVSESLVKDLPEGKEMPKTFHWPLEFPEVFLGDRRGFDAILGNPPYIGGQKISGVLGKSFGDYLKQYCTFSKKAAVDLVVNFSIRASKLLHSDGIQGLVVRRSISEGKNREVGYDQFEKNNITIFSAVTDVPWPGEASVVVHYVFAKNGIWSGLYSLNNEKVDLISPYLNDFEGGAPSKIKLNKERIFQGIILQGEGFKIDEDFKDALFKVDGNKNIVHPFIGGSEVNSDPFLNPQSWVLCFWDWPEDKAKGYSLAYDYVFDNVKPERQRTKDNGDYVLRSPLPVRWWQYGEKRPAMFHALGWGENFNQHPDDWEKRPRLERFLVISTGVTKYPAFTFMNRGMFCSNKLCVLADDRYEMFGVLSSDIHSAWAWQNKTSMGADLSSMVYAHGNIFETFPFPDGFFSDAKFEALQRSGKDLFEARDRYMKENELGLTKFYNDFNDPKISNNEINSIREAQNKLNIHVLDAYQLNDIELNMDFHEVGYLPAGANTRYTMSELSRKKVLRFLSSLNKLQTTNKDDKKQEKKSAQKNDSSQGSLFL